MSGVKVELMRARTLAFSSILLALAVLGLILIPLPTTAIPQTNSVDISNGKVVSFYQSILDSSIDGMIRVLSDTGTEIVFRGYFKYRGASPSEFQQLRETIDGVKARLPWVQFIGGITASAFNPGDYWPNGTRVSAEQLKQILWLLPSGAFAHHYEDLDMYVMDITKPLARQFILAYAYKLVDAGFDSLWFDEVTYIPWILNEQDNPNPNYVAAWHQMVAAVKDYALTKYNKTLLVSMNGDWLKTSGARTPWPYQDFLTVSVNLDTVKSGKMQDDWAAYKAQVKRVYGYTPTILYFIDYTPLVALASQPTTAQIKLLKLFYETSIREQVIPVFPLHYGLTYDAKWQGTYDTIKQLAGTISTVHTLTSVYTSTTTVTTTMPAKTSPPVTALDLGLVALVIAMGIALAVLKRNKKHRHP